MTNISQKARTYITLDYELFLGRETGTVDACLIQPMQRLEALADKYPDKGIKYVLFVDTLFLLKLSGYSSQSSNLFDDWSIITKQLKNLTSKGHDVQLHLHPQWFYSSYDFDNKQWILDFDHYKLSDCPLDEVETMLRDSIDLLEDIVGYRPSAYRAGGYSYPIRKEYIDLFAKYGIVKDSSVLMRKVSTGKYQSYDYSSIKDYSSYHFSNSNIEKDANGLFIEYPISTKDVSPFLYFPKIIIEKRKNKTDLKVMGDGRGVGTTFSRSKRIADKIMQLFKPVCMPASIDSTNVLWLNNIYNAVKVSNSDTMVIIGHPKNCTTFALNIFEDFVRKYDCFYSTFRL